MADSVEARIVRLETKDEARDDVLDSILEEQRATRAELQKFNNYATWGRAAIFVVVGFGSALLWLWGQFKGLILR